MLRKREEDEAILQIGKRKIKNQHATEHDHHSKIRRTQRFDQPADFSFPSPLIDRPRTESGSTSFHFAYTTISKQGSPTYKQKPLKQFTSGSSSPGADHASYIERDDAAEVSAGAAHAGYIERETAIERTLSTSSLDNDPDELNEDASKEEAAILGPIASGNVPSIFSNISDNKFEREEYWRAVHRTEREAKIHSLIPDPEAAPLWWASLEAMTSIPDGFEGFRNHALRQKDRYTAWLESEAKKDKPKPFHADPFPLTSEGCGKALLAAADLRGWNDSKPPVEFKSGPGGKVQLRFVAELPAEVSPEDRALIVHNFCHHLETFSKDEHGNPQGLMYTAVVHAPDAHNDKRNYHLHIIAHPRPAKWMPDKRAWDFDVPVEYDHKGETRTHYPYRQNKIGEVERKLKDSHKDRHAHYNNAVAGGDFIPAMRRKFAEINNAVLAARGIERRYDPRRYSQMGIDRTPTEHLGTRAAALEAAGVPTIIGRLNAISIWSDAERNIRARANAIEARLANSQAELAEFVTDAMTADLRTPEVRKLRVLAAERERLVENIADERRALMIFDHLEAKAKSRAVRTRLTCLQILTEAQRIPGTHSKAEIKAVKKRFAEAQAHIEKIDAELAPDRLRILEAAEDVRQREARIRAIDKALFPLRAQLIDRVEAVRKLPNRGRPTQPVKPYDIYANDPSLLPTTNQEQQEPAPEQSNQQTPAAPAAQLPAKELTDEQITRRNRNLLATKARLFISSSELAPLPNTPIRQAGSISQLRGLSSIDLVRNARTTPVLLHNLQTAHMGRRRVRSSQGPGQGLRRSGASSRSLEQSAGTGIDRVELDDVPAAAMAPPTLAGIPITQPVLPGLPDAISDGVGETLPVPEGLLPLAPDVPQAPAAIVPAPDATIPDGPPAELADETVQPSPEPAPTPQPKEPAKPTITLADHSAWDEIINRVAQNRIPIEKRFGSDNKVTYHVPSLPASDRAVINSPRFAKRSSGRLAAIHSKQEQEVERLIRWIAENGQDPANLIIEGNSARLNNAPQSVHTLFNDWLTNKRVLDQLRNERGRRLALEEVRRREEAMRPAPSQQQPEPIPVTAPDRAAELAKLYPPPEDARTPQVRTFLELLHADAPADALRAAAEDIAKNAVAREDVHRHRVELATAFNTAIDDDLGRIIQEMQSKKTR